MIWQLPSLDTTAADVKRVTWYWDGSVSEKTKAAVQNCPDLRMNRFEREAKSQTMSGSENGPSGKYGVVGGVTAVPHL